MEKKSQVCNSGFVCVLTVACVAKLNQICDLLTYSCSSMETQKVLFRLSQHSHVMFARLKTELGCNFLLLKKKNQTFSCWQCQLAIPFLLCNRAATCYSIPTKQSHRHFTFFVRLDYLFDLRFCPGCQDLYNNIFTCSHTLQQKTQWRNKGG